MPIGVLLTRHLEWRAENIERIPAQRRKFLQDSSVLIGDEVLVCVECINTNRIVRVEGPVKKDEVICAVFASLKPMNLSKMQQS